MDCYKLRNDLRNLEEDPGSEDVLHLPKELCREIEQKLLEFDRVNALIHNYKEVLRDVLK